MTDSPFPDEDRPGVRAVSTLSVIAARKVDFVTNAIHRARDALTPRQLDHLRTDLVNAVDKLDWRLFVTDIERVQRKLNLGTKLEDLDRRTIWEAVEQKLGRHLRPE